MQPSGSANDGPGTPAEAASVPRHPIRVVQSRTGLSPDVLRAWERRYSLVAPARSEGGQRLYSDADIEKLRLLHRATQAGRGIGQVAELSVEALEQLLAEDEAAHRSAEIGILPDTSSDNPVAVALFLAQCIAAVEKLDSAQLESALRRAALALTSDQFTDQLVSPLLREIGSRWHSGTLRASHEHLASVVVTRVLSWAAELNAASASENRIVVSTPAGQKHSLGAMLAAASAAAQGWNVTLLGADLPAEDIADAARQVGADAIALSVVMEDSSGELLNELRKLRELLPGRVSIMVGGAGTDSARELVAATGVSVTPTLADLRRELRRLAV